MQARYYDPVIGRFYSNDPVGYTAKNPVMSFNRYLYVNNNPYKFKDPDGRELVGIMLPGLNSSDSNLKTREFLVDKTIASNVQGFATEAIAKFPQLSVNNTLRTRSSSSITTTNTKASGLSRHNAGFAVDLNGTATLSKSELGELRSIASSNGLGTAINADADKPHFSADPTSNGYTSLSEAVKENTEHYDTIKADVNDPIE